jgi:PAS domain-containing protein
MSELAFAIGEVASMLGLSPHTIRAWERRHLLSQPARTAAGQRRYTADDVELLRQVKYERHVHGLSMRVATLAAQGLLPPDAGDAGGPNPVAPASSEGPADPLGMVADLVPEVVVIVDAGGRIRHANTAFVRFSDVLAGQLQGLLFAEFVDPFDRAKAVQVHLEPRRIRRGWELGLRTKSRRGYFSFDCWPVPGPDGPMLVLVGRQLDVGPPIPDPVEVSATAEPAWRAAPAQVRALLAGVADPVRTLELMRPWLDSSPLGIVLVTADADSKAQVANEAFRRLASPGLLPVEGRLWRELAPDGDRGVLTAAVREVAASAQCRTVSGRRPPWDDHLSPPPTIWDVELCPVIEVAGGVSHVLLTVRDATAEVATVRMLEALASSTSEISQAPDARQVLTVAARHVHSLLPNAGWLVAAVRGREQSVISVVAADGLWGHARNGTERELRLALVRDVVRTGASIEIERTGVIEAVETLRIVPLLATPAAPGTTVLGALAVSRLDAGPFAAGDRQLMDEFAGRVGMAMGRADALGPVRGEKAPLGG